jgi:DNA polymerase-1
MELIFDAASLHRDAMRLTGGDTKLTQIMLLRLAYKAMMAWHPSAIYVMRDPDNIIPFNGTVATDNPLRTVRESNVDLSDTIVVSNAAGMLGLADVVPQFFTTTKDMLDLRAVTFNRARDELGFNPKDADVFNLANHSIYSVPATVERGDKARAGRDRVVRWAWVDDTTRVDYGKPLLATANNIHVKVGKTGFQNYEVVQDIGTVLNLLDHSNGVIGWDTETTGLDWRRDRVVGESLSIDGHRGYYVPLLHQQSGGQYHNLNPQEYAERVRPRLAQTRLRGANLGFDVLFTSRSGLGIPRGLEDIQGYAYMLGINVPDQSKIGLKALARDVLNDEMVEYAQVSQGATFDQVPIDRAAPYAADDAAKSFRLATVLRERLSVAQRARYDAIEMPFLYTLIRMMYNGMYLDVDEVEVAEHAMRMELENLEGLIFAHSGGEFDIRSPKQMQKVLFERLGVPLTKRTKTGYSTAAAELESIEGSHPIITKILEWRELEKLLNTYLSKYPTHVRDDGRVHSTLSAFKVISARIASQDPNLMNIPVRSSRGRLLRAMFKGQGDDMLLGTDASQLEYRILAHYLDDPRLIAAFSDPTRDIHNETASIIFSKPADTITKDERDQAKTAFYAILYGAAAPKLAGTLGISIGAAANIISKISSELNIDRLRKSVLESARRLGYVESFGGHRSYIWGLHSGDSVTRGHAERAAFDVLFQGTASGDVTKIACITTQDALDELYPDVMAPKVKLIQQIHDEILLEGPRDELERVKDIPANAFKTALTGLKVPIEAKGEIGKSWADVH